MSVVWKFPFRREEDALDRLAVELPTGSLVLAFDFQRDVPTLWALVDDSLGVERETRTFVLLGTGRLLSPGVPLVHVGSALGFADALVLHCFEEVRP